MSENIPEKPKKAAYEWVLIPSKGDEIILTENQYAFYKENYKEAKVFVGDHEINPAFIVQSFKRLATSWLKDKYPCKACATTGRHVDNEKWCPECEGSGVKLP